MDIALRLIYFANVLVAGWISLTSLFAPKTALHSIFENTYAYSEAFRLVGALWGAIFILSCVGLFLPRAMALVLVFQVIYKSSWLLFAALPAHLAGNPYPRGMAGFFIIWVLVLPFVIPWRVIFHIH